MRANLGFGTSEIRGSRPVRGRRQRFVESERFWPLGDRRNNSLWNSDCGMVFYLVLRKLGVWWWRVTKTVGFFGGGRLAGLWGYDRRIGPGRWRGAYLSQAHIGRLVVGNCHAG